MIGGMACLSACLPIFPQAQEFRYHGLCDASAAVALGTGHFVVAEDEHDILVVYKRGMSTHVGEPIVLIDYLGNRKHNGKVKEADVEGAARIHNRIYWIASHGRDKKRDVEETRWRFFATDVVESGSTPTVKVLATQPYTQLLHDLLGEKKFEALGLAVAATKAPEHPEGLNIEGLAATPEGQLLIGLRNPRPGGQAILIPLTNPEEVINKSGKPIFGDPILLDLGQRGIRSIELIGMRYVIVAGSFDDGNHGSIGSDFALFTWTGYTADRPVPIREITFGMLRPEALFLPPGTEEIVVLSDDGSEKVEGRECKEEGVPTAKKSFRSLTFKLR